MSAASDQFRARVRSILIDRASLDEHIEEYFDEVLDDLVAVYVDLAEWRP